jgi:hypothetical protein
MRFRTSLFFVSFLSFVVFSASELPTGFVGVWQGLPDLSVLGPFDQPFNFTIHQTRTGWLMYDLFLGDYDLIPNSYQKFTVIEGDDNHLGQLVYDGFLQNYFVFPGPIEVVFEQVSQSDTMIQWCYSPIPSTVCWTLTLLNSSTLQSQFYLASPVKHFHSIFTKISNSSSIFPQSSQQLRDLSEKSEFPQQLPCPYVALSDPSKKKLLSSNPSNSFPQARELAAKYDFCYILNPKLQVILAWSLSNSSLSATISIAKQTTQPWVALGIGNIFPGMFNADVMLGYFTDENKGCVRSMYVPVYVGTPVDQTQQVLTQVALGDAYGALSLTFTREFDSGHNVINVTQQTQIIWATGNAPSTCDEDPYYHGNLRGNRVVVWSNPVMFPPFMKCSSTE